MFGIYVHIPFCLQRCKYCDFATYSQDQIKVNSIYVDHLLLEIRKNKHLFSEREVDTIYFGGGTPSLLPAHDIRRILSTLKEEGFQWKHDIEITMEINPATVTQDKFLAYRELGVNRMSLGVQTFSDHHLKLCDRKHSATETLETIELFKKFNLSYSLDLLYTLPEQTQKLLQSDLNKFVALNPDHISAYWLTLPEKHPMNLGRPNEDAQVEMFNTVRKTLLNNGYNQYEISNFCRPGFESRHNTIYWIDEPYWGIGLSAHSYSPTPEWGVRFWNPSDYNGYLKKIQNLPENSDSVSETNSKNTYEKLNVHQSLTDFCHTSLRMERGLIKNSLRQKFGLRCHDLISQRLKPLVLQNKVQESNSHWKLTPEGILISNLIFQELLVTPEDIDISPERYKLS